MTLAELPAKNPCGSCPYRKDVPPGVWSAEEYAKLPPYDNETPAQPHGMFLCHRQDGHLCAGWAATHDMTQSLSLRLAAMREDADPDWFDAVIDYVTDVLLWDSGTEAAEHGLSDMTVGPHNEKIIERVRSKQA